MRALLPITLALMLLALPVSAKEALPSAREEGIGATNASCPLGVGPHVIENAQAIESTLPQVYGASCEFTFTPLASAEIGKLVMSGLAAGTDFDLFVKRNGIPTTSDWDCRPWFGGAASETCEVTVNAGDSLGVMVRRFNGGGPFKLTASSITVPEIPNGIPVDVSLGGTGQYQLFKLVVPPGAGSVVLEIAPASAGTAASSACLLGQTPCVPDADLYVGHRFIPTTRSYTCRPFSDVSAETCTFQDEVHEVVGQDPTALDVNEHHPYLGPGKYFVMLHSFAGAPVVVLQGTTV